MNWFCNAIIVIFLALMANASPAAELTNKNTLNEEDVLIVELNVGQIPTEDNVAVYQHQGGFLVPLGLLTQLIDFPIDVNIDTGQASGWFIKQDRSFILDINRRTVIIEGKEKPLDSRIITLGADDIYVDSSLFSEWFPVDVELDFAHLLLKLKPREKLPFQLKEDRKNRHNIISATDKKPNDYPSITTPPANFTMPFMDIDLGNQYDTKSSPNNIASFSVLAQGDAARLSTNLYISGDSKEDLTSARIKSGNKDKDANLLGAMRATEYSIGDIDSIALPMVSANGHGYGAYISNFDLTRPDQFDQTSFIGDSQPGWEVELYRNGELLEFQLIGENGRYAFNNIPVLYGNNNFKIISYGPQGQVREDTKNYTIDDSIAQQGKFNYRFSADEKSQSIFGIDEQATTLQTRKEGRFIGNVEYGLTDNLTVTTGAISTPLEDLQTHNYQTLGLKGNYFGALTSISTAYDYQNNGLAGAIAINRNIKDISARIERKQFDNFVSEVETTTSPRRIATSKIDVNGQISSLLPSGMTYGLGAQAEEFVGDRQTISYTNRLATSLFGIGFGNNLQWQETQTAGNSVNVGSGSFSVRGNYKQVFLRFSADYDVAPESALKAVNLSMQKELFRNINLRSDIKKDLSSTNLTSVNLALNKEFRHYRLSAIASGDTADTYTLGVRLSFSLGKNTANDKWFANSRNTASDGAISASAFLDKNYNGLYDGDDTVIENAGFQTGNKKYPPGEDKESTLINGIPPYVPTEIELDTATLEDPFLTPEIAGYAVTTRPGVVTKVTFPVIYTTEIDGTIYHQIGDNAKPVARAIVQLQDSDGKVVNTTKSEYDGFYIFSGVVPGNYTIVLAPETLDKLKAVSSPDVAVNIPPNSDTVSGMDITASDDELSY